MPGLGVLLGPGFILYLDVSALVKKICIVFFLVLIMGVFCVSAEGTEVVLGNTTEIGEGEKTPDNPYRIEGYAPDSVTVGDVVYGVPCEPLYGNSEFQDSYDVVTGVETRKWSLMILDGTESWAVFTNPVNSAHVYYFLQIDKKIGYQTSICSHFINVDNSISSDVGQSGMYMDGSNNQYIYFLFTSSTISDFRAWLAEQYAAGTPVQLLYELKEPVTIQHEPIVIGNRHLISLQDSLQWVIQNVLTVIQIVALDPVLMLGISVWCFGGVVFLFRRLV